MSSETASRATPAAFSALAASDVIVADYRRYLQSLVEPRLKPYRDRLFEQIKNDRDLAKGPILEATPRFEFGSSIEDLIADGTLAPAFRELDCEALPVKRALYQHQEDATRKAVAGRNVVVATGTGSGKTESFLIPVLNHHLVERAAGTLGPGVRALFLYPMNALANDQMKRLRKVLAGFPDITFGRYTGETPEKYDDAKTKFSERNPGEPMLANELISREQMRETPPNILLTNYAMLEYLLIRPKDMDLFEGDSAGVWSFLVVDEAHMYDGALGAELAMLLRRLVDRVKPSGKVQCIATSATVGDNPTKVVDFATKLFGVPFDWEATKSGQQDFVKATRRAPEAGTWGPLEAETWRELAEMPSAERDDRIVEIAGQRGAKSANAYQALATERSVAQLRKDLASKPRRLVTLAATLFPDSPDPKNTVAQVIDVASSIYDDYGLPLLSVRYHLWVRATDGAYSCIGVDPHIRLARHEVCLEGDCGRPVFQLSACKRCGATYFTGQLDPVTGGLVPPRTLAPGDSGALGKLRWLQIEPNDSIDDEDEQVAERDESEAAELELREFCGHCGILNPPGSSACSGCKACGLVKVGVRSGGGAPKNCASCGSRGVNAIRQLDTGADAASAVLSTSLYHQIPEAPGEEGLLPGQGRKLLAFSDSRQGAAFFGPYLERTYRSFQHRALLYQALSTAGRTGGGYATLDDVLDSAVTLAGGLGLFPQSVAPVSLSQRRREVAQWIAGELVPIETRQSLEGLGLMSVLPYVPDDFQVPPPLAKLGLNREEVVDLIAELLQIVRQQGGMRMPEGAHANHPDFEPRLGPFYIRVNGSDPKKKVLSWLPTRGRNRRLDYLERLLAKCGNADREHARSALEGMWRVVTSEKHPWVKQVDAAAQLGPVFQVDPEMMIYEPVVAGGHLFQCSNCRTVTTRSVRGVCSMLRCDGELRDAEMPQVQDDEVHYRVLAREMNPVALRSVEHTAQWRSTEAAKLQFDFVRGRINALSCSTTFELGVDVGDLETVQLRNVPPTTANYVQRAGRAGRRAASAALVLTFANRTSHDLTLFKAPEDMIAGAVRAPFVPLDNERIDRRHAHSIALSAFFREQADSHARTWTNAGQFFLGEEGVACAVPILEEYLRNMPTEVTDAVRRVIPPQVVAQIGVDDCEWVEGLIDLVALNQDQIGQDVGFFREQELVASKLGKHGIASHMQRVARTLTKAELLGVLSGRNILPKYGFPVDVVPLRTAHLKDEVGARVELDRDLGAAIHEYAPGSTLVAGGKLWTSGGVYRLPERELRFGYYSVCTSCGEFREAHEKGADACERCQGAIKWHYYIVPEFGFAAAASPTDVPKSPPRRSWSGGVYASNFGDIEELDVDLGSDAIPMDVAVGTRATLMAVADGLGGAGFQVCDWCGAGAPVAAGGLKKPHPRLLRQFDTCDGPARYVRLAYSFQTDILTIRPSLGTITASQARSLLYAVLSASSTVLELSQNDIDGSVQNFEGFTQLVVFDTVPGGAGSAREIGENLGEILDMALKSTQACTCGEETSCYACLRTFRNQRYHEQLNRRDAIDMLQKIVGSGS